MPRVDVAAMADSEQVCGCNGVTKGAICRVIQEKGLVTLDAVRAHTKASSSHGSCVATVEAILAHLTGGAVVRSADPPICKCAGHGHDSARRCGPGRIAARACRNCERSCTGPRRGRLCRRRTTSGGEGAG
jgi:NAD(P)H-nitrite reductase large subunit